MATPPAVAERPADSPTRLSKRQQRRLWRGGQYALLVIVIVLVAILADWGQIGRAFFDIPVALAQFPEVITVGLVNTIEYTALGFALGLVLGVLLALMRLSSIGAYRWISTVYIEFFRGLPALLVFLAIGTGLPLAFPNLDLPRLVSIMIALGIVGAAYMAETIRAGIQAVPRGQVEAARSLGMSSSRAMITVVLPQAFRIILPPLTNELILLTKDSSLAFLLGATLDQQELAQFGRLALNQYKGMTPILVVGLMYLVITIPLSLLQRRLERKHGEGVSGGTET